MKRWKQLKLTRTPKRCRQCRWYYTCMAEKLLPKLKNGCDSWEVR